MPGLLNPKKAARELQGMGVRGDTILAHINPREVSLLKAHGGAGTKNPRTGLLQFDSEGGGEGPGGEGGGNGPGMGADGGDSGNGNGGSDPSGGLSSGSMSGKGDNSPAGPNGETTDANEAMGVDTGVAQGPGPGVSINGPSMAGILGAIAAGALGPGVSTANSLTGLNDPGGKTAASHAMEAMGISGTPMGSMSFGGTPGDVGHGPGPNGPASGGQGFDGQGVPYGAPNTPSAPSPQLAAFPAAPSLLAPPPKPQNNVWPYMPFGTMPFTPKR